MLKYEITTHQTSLQRNDEIAKSPEKRVTARQRNNRKKWLLVQPISNTSMMVDSGTVSMPLNLIMVATIPLLATKGCPVGCNFCTTPAIYGKSCRYRELDLVLDEMRYHQQRLGKKRVNFSFMDNNISFRPQYFFTLLEEMAKLGVHWNANISMNFLDKPEVAELAGRSSFSRRSVKGSHHAEHCLTSHCVQLAFLNE